MPQVRKQMRAAELQQQKKQRTSTETQALYNALLGFSQELYYIGVPIFKGDILPLLTDHEFGKDTSWLQRIRASILTQPETFGKPLSLQNEPLGIKLTLNAATRASNNKMFVTALRKLFSLTDHHHLPFYNTDLNIRLGSHGKSVWTDFREQEHQSVADFHKGMFLLFFIQKQNRKWFNHYFE